MSQGISSVYFFTRLDRFSDSLGVPACRDASLRRQLSSNSELMSSVGANTAEQEEMKMSLRRERFCGYWAYRCQSSSCWRCFGITDQFAAHRTHPFKRRSASSIRRLNEHGIFGTARSKRAITHNRAVKVERPKQVWATDITKSRWCVASAISLPSSTGSRGGFSRIACRSR